MSHKAEVVQQLKAIMDASPLVAGIRKVTEYVSSRNEAFFNGATTDIAELTGIPKEELLDPRHNGKEFAPEHGKQVVAILRKHANKTAKDGGEWAGMPLPISQHELVLEPRYPYPSLNGMTINESDDDKTLREGFAWLDTFERLKQHKVEPPAAMVELYQQLKAILDPPDEKCFRLINRWRHKTLNGFVEIWEMPGGKRFHQLRYNVNQAFRMALNTLGAVQEAFTLDIEMRAHEKLKTMLKPHQYAQYFINGMFLEHSPRSGVIYVFRRLRPTVATIADKQTGDMKILGCLCLHPVGYYQGTWCGALCPTDDVIAHLTLMRGDEHHFWRKSNLHSPLDPASGM